jgi:AbrB family looped-hinge helix DNA binding protein
MQAPKSKLASKGQTTIPLEVRKRLGIREGDQIEFDIAKAEIVIRPVRTAENPFRKWRGAAGGFPGEKNEINAWVREMRGRNEGTD